MEWLELEEQTVGSEFAVAFLETLAKLQHDFHRRKVDDLVDFVLADRQHPKQTAKKI